MHAIGSVATVGFLLLNIIPRQSLVEVDDVNACLKTYLFFAMLVNFASLIAACWVLFGTYVTGAITPVYPGVAILLQTLLIVSSSFLYRFGPRNESY
ncbi:Vacuolar protein sorting-associated protein 68 [Sparganum proliferum]